MQQQEGLWGRNLMNYFKGGSSAFSLTFTETGFILRSFYIVKAINLWKYHDRVFIFLTFCVLVYFHRGVGVVFVFSQSLLSWLCSSETTFASQGRTQFKELFWSKEWVYLTFSTGVWMKLQLLPSAFFSVHWKSNMQNFWNNLGRNCLFLVFPYSIHFFSAGKSELRICLPY